MSEIIKEWRCSVCGYIHKGATPPTQCVVCGAPEDAFEAFGGDQPEKKEKVSGWKCLVCHYNHKGDTPPSNCPICGAGAKKFEPLSPSEPSKTTDSIKRRILIVGAGIAGVSAAEAARKESSSAEIVLLSKEDHLPYYRLNLTRLLAGEVDVASLPIHPESWYTDNRIELILNAEVVECRPAARVIQLRDGQRLDYDKLIITAGAHPFIPPVPGAQKNGVTTIRTKDHAQMILESAATSTSAVVIGGGILGLEVAAGLIKASPDLPVTVVEGFEYLMPRQLNRKASTRLMAHVKSLGITLETGTSVKEIEGDERAARIVLSNGKTLDADLVIFAAGVRPNSYLARTSGLNVNQGIIVNDFMETSVEGIYAAGDTAEHRGVLYGLWNAAMYQGAIAGMNAAGKKAGFGGIPRSNTIKVLGVDLFSIGSIEACDGSCTVIEKDQDDVYINLIFRDGHLEGAILYGDTTTSAVVKKAIEEKRDFSRALEGSPIVDSLLEFKE
ncbi:MAG: FAD-dependent oxidoreductase [Proteobacteria bacterium]|nr:FAD-dependent oxidoreductase [Pseudomonadota bacterium]